MRIRSLLIAAVGLLWAASIVIAQTPPAAVSQSAQASPAGQEKPQEKKPAPEIPIYEEQVVVTASKIEQKLINAPATVSLISGQTLENVAGQNYADLLRSVPGVNVSQTSARDINITSRGATSTLSTSQLALMDGRSIYQDFFGFVAWDFLPINLNEVKQIEVIRGPASAVWGANAMTGVINVITKTPREMQGTSVAMSLGTFDRSVEGRDAGAGSLFSISASHARAINDRWAFKVSAGAMTQDALPRPAGTIPNRFNTPYPTFENQGTRQPKVDARVDYDHPDGRQRVVIAAGMAGTEGLIHTGIGPFDIQRGTVLGYGKVNYSRGAFKLNAFVNLLDGEGLNLLAVDTRGRPINFLFKNQTYDLEVGNVSTIGTRHVISYGGNFRRNQFDLSLASRDKERNEGGAYVQDEIFLNDYVRWLVGARVDKFDTIADPVVSPRTTLMLKPAPEHTFRLSYNRAYRSPSLVNNFLDVLLANQIDLGLINPLLAGRNYAFPVRADGNPDLKQEEMTAYEIGYSGIIGQRATVSAAFYVNDSKNTIFFRQVGSYTAAAPPPGWPLPPTVLNLLIAGNAFGPGNGLPSSFSYQNLGKTRDKGVELGIDAAMTNSLSMFANYSWQAKPKPTGFDISDLNLPPTNRFNVGVNLHHDVIVGSFSVNYQDEAFWQDVLDARYNGPTDGFTLVNASVGVRWRGDRLLTTLKVNNIGNEAVQHHVFGDVIKRQIVGELRMSF